MPINLAEQISAYRRDASREAQDSLAQRSRARCLLYVSLLALICAASSQAQGVITTFAGANQLFQDDHQAATALLISKITSVTLDASGNPVFAAPYRNVVVRINTDGSITRLAGTGASDFSGDHGKAVNAALRNPQNAAFDSSGNLYVSDTLNNLIRRVSLDGTITTFAGGGQNAVDNIPATQSQLNFPTSIVVDSNNNLYINDAQNYRIRRVTPSGIISTYAGNGTCANSPDNQPADKVPVCSVEGIALDPGGNLFLADFGHHRVRRVDAVTKLITTVAGIGTPGSAQDGSIAVNSPLRNPGGVSIDTAGNLYISDTGNERILKVTNGIITTIAGNGGLGYSGEGAGNSVSLHSPFGLAIDTQGNLYFADRDNFRVRKLDTNGQVSTVAGNGLSSFDSAVPVSSLPLSLPFGVTIGTDGSLYIADSNSDVIRKVGPDGLVFTVAGTGAREYSGNGDLATKAGLSGPANVGFDAAGNLYIADTGNNVVRKVDKNRTISTVAGNPFSTVDTDVIPATQAALNRPTAVAFDSAGNLLIADTGHNRIRRVSNGIITTVAGTGRPGFADGPATSALLNSPIGLAVDPNGIVYIADAGNRRVRKLSNGVVTTIAGGGNTPGAAADGGPATAASLGEVFGVTTDGSGNVYFADTSNSQVRKITPGAIISTVAGNGRRGFAGDAGSPQQASLSGPTQVAIDATTGNIFIAESGSDRIRLVSSRPPIFQTNPSSLAFTGFSQGLVTSPKSVTITSNISGPVYTVDISPPASWLTINPQVGQIPSTFNVFVDPSGLDPGAYDTTIVITSPTSIPSTQRIPVHFTVTPAPQPILSVEVTQLPFSFARTAAPSSRSFRVRNTGGGNLAFSVSAATNNGGAWLSASAVQGAARPAQPFALTVSADPSGLNPGTYTGAVTISNQNGNDSVVIPTTMTVSGAPQTMALSQTGLTFTGVQAGGLIPTQTFEVINTGPGTMNWTLSTETLDGGSGWLSVNPASGSSDGGSVPPSITVQVDPSGLTAGTYYGQIAATSATALNSPQVLTVVLNVLAADQNPGPVVQPSGLIFTGTAGGPNPDPQTVSIYDLISTPLNVGSSRTFVGIGNWFVHDPASSTVTPNTPVTITVRPHIDGLPAGVYIGALSLAFSDGSERAVSIRLILAPSGGSTSKADRMLSTSCTPQTLVPLFTTLADSFSVPASWPIPLVMRVFNDCGNPVTDGSVVVAFSNGDTSVALSSLRDGRWEGTWASQNVAPSLTTLTATAQSSAPPLTATLSISGSVQTNSDPPVITASGITPNSSPGLPIAPGALISIYGRRLANATVAAAGLPLETDLEGVEVLMRGDKMPLLSVSDGQVKAVVPYSVPVNETQYLVVRRGKVQSNVIKISLAETLPAVFANLQGQGDITGSDGHPLQPGNPAKAGDAAIISCTGLGAVQGEVPAGTAAPSDPPAATLAPVTVTIGGQPATVLFSGLTPGTAGMYQIKVLVPDGVSAGDSVPVVITTLGRSSVPVTMAVQ